MSNCIDSTRDRLIDTTCELLHARGYGQVGVQAICHRAGVNKGSFYHHFDSKQTLTLAVIQRYEDEVLPLFDQALAGNDNARDRIGRLIDTIYRFQVQAKERTGHVLGCPFGNLANEMSTSDEPLRRRLEQTFSLLAQRIARVLREGVLRGDLPGMDTDKTGAAIFAYLEGILLVAKTRNDPSVIKRIGPSVLNLHLS